MEKKEKKLKKSKTYKLFLYGTLRRGEALHYILEKFNPIFKGLGILKEYKMYCNYFYPFIIKGSESDKVIGEVYEFSEEDYFKIIKDLDMIEGNYDRTIVTIELNQKNIKAETYISKYPVDKEDKIDELDGIRLIKNGDWKKGD